MRSAPFSAAICIAVFPRLSVIRQSIFRSVTSILSNSKLFLPTALKRQAIYSSFWPKYCLMKASELFD